LLERVVIQLYICAQGEEKEMTRREFEQLRDLPDKVISDDVKFSLTNATSPNLTFEEILITNSLNWEVVLNGTYKPSIPSVTYNFVIRGTGPICRVCVNAMVHKDVGRTHKHDLQDEQDSRRNLPTAVARPDLVGKTARKIWDDLMQRANIIHTGRFIDPEVT
jgi:hypothetical protein